MKKILIYIIICLLYVTCVIGVVTIDTTINPANMGGTGKNIVVCPNGIVHTVYIDATTNYIIYANFTTDNSTFGLKQISESKSFRSPGILCDSNNDLFVYARRESDEQIIFYESTDDGVSWGLEKQISSVGTDLNSPSCVLDSNNIKHCTYVEYSLGTSATYYTNGTTQTEFLANDLTIDSAVGTSLCDVSDIGIDINNNPWIVCVGEQNGDVYIWNQSSGFGEGKSLKIHDFPNNYAFSRYNTQVAISFATDERNSIYIVANNGTDTNSHIQLINGTTEGIGTWSHETINRSSTASNYHAPEIEITEGNDIYVSARGNWLSGFTFASLILINNSEGGVFGTNNITMATNTPAYTGFSHIAKQLFPISSRIKNQLVISYVDDQNDDFEIYFLDIPYVTKTVPIQIKDLEANETNDLNISINWTNQDSNQNDSVIYVNDVINASVLYPIASYTIINLQNNTQYNITVKARNATGTNNTISTENSILVTTGNPNIDEINFIGLIGVNATIIEGNKTWFSENMGNDVNENNITAYDKVLIRFNNITGNYTQKYEFYYEIGTNITVEMMNLTTDIAESYIKLYDKSHSPLIDTRVLIYQTDSSKGGNYTLINQVYSDTQGYVNFYYKPTSTVKIVITKDGYKQQPVFQDIILSERTKSDPLILYMDIVTSTYSPIIMSIPSEIRNKSKNIYFKILYTSGTNMTYTTGVRQALGLNNKALITETIGYDGFYVPKDFYQGILETDVDFISASSDDIRLMIYNGDNMIIDFTIEYIGTYDTDILNIPSKGLDEVSLKIIAFISLMVIVVVMQTSFGIQNESIGLHTFMIGNMLLAFVSSGFAVIGIISGAFYIMQLLRKIIGVA